MQRFYGGRPGEWLEIPARLYWAYVRMMPVLHARESIDRLNELLYASERTMQNEQARRFITERQRLASGVGVLRDAQRPLRPKSIEELQGLMGPNVKIQLEG